MSKPNKEIKSSKEIQEKLDKTQYFSKKLTELDYHVPYGTRVEKDNADENIKYGLFCDIEKEDLNEGHYIPNGNVYIMKEIDREYLAQVISFYEYDLKKAKKLENKNSKKQNKKSIFDKILNKDKNQDEGR